uniref:Uncharacterized protein n=1 Tax=Poecilia reticulata TaxID=8081 RepID=A0A3P9N6H2_POERE
ICSSMNQSMCRINYVIGDLFTASNHESLAHCVSRDLRMGKGIVVLFKNKFGRTSELKGQSELLVQILTVKCSGVKVESPHY